MLRGNKQTSEEQKYAAEIDNITGYDYLLDDRDTQLYKEKFLELKNILESDTIDYEEYAKLLGMLYIIDLYTIDNKTNKYDIGGVEFVWTPAQDNFKLKVQDTIYKYIEDNTYGDRDEELPIVSTIDIEAIEDTTIKLDDTNYEGYKLNLTWEYVSDYGYDKECELIIIKDEEKLYVVEQNVS